MERSPIQTKASYFETEQSSFTDCLNEIKRHPAWKKSMSRFEAEEALKDQPDFTFLIRKRDYEGRFTLSCIIGGETTHHILRVVQDDDGSYKYMNGVWKMYDDVNELIKTIMRAPNLDICRPLRSKPVSSLIFNPAGLPVKLFF